MSELVTLSKFIKTFSRNSLKKDLEAAKKERSDMLALFPLEKWPVMTLEEYALGLGENQNVFCRWLEYLTPNLGSMRGGTARKLLIYKYKDKPGWFFDSQYNDEKEAWEAIRAGIVQALELAGSGEFNRIDDIDTLSSGPTLKLKTLCLYFPNEIIPIYSQDHLQFFLKRLGYSGENPVGRPVDLNRLVLKILRAKKGLADWSNQELMRLMYAWADPRETKRVVKIAPGDNAMYWEECLTGQYICVGWDEVGDLRDFENKADFTERFSELYLTEYKNHKPTTTRKAGEVWTLRELEPGDIIVANKGISRILGLGTVVEPGYEWMPEREKYKHIVRVKWDISFAQDIHPPQRKWGVTTVAKIPNELYADIIKKKLPIPASPLFEEISAALESKGQAILYGPPGTGKTFHARRFAVWWLLNSINPEKAQEILSDANVFIQEEQRMATGKLVQKIWWMVANPDIWRFDKLFQDGSVEFSIGRLARNFAQIQVGDLVTGYHSSPEKRIVALARVSRGLQQKANGEQTIELIPVTYIENGPGYDELQKDDVMKNSEPIRFRCQGTLFSLTDIETEYLSTLLIERNPEIQKYLVHSSFIGQINNVTFHPSYSYEDFVEGYRPVDNGGGSLVLCLEPGIFKRICREAQVNPEKKYILMVDEINRANVARVFGELITLLEKDKRGMMVTLPQSKEPFMIPPNVYMLGTMNTSDRSIKLLDAALRRRFAFIELMPDIDVLLGSKVGNLRLDLFLEELNQRISSSEGREKQIGHSFLMKNGEPATEPDEFARCFRQEILPLLQEMCYDDYARLAEFLGESLVDKTLQGLNMDLINDPDSLVEALEKEFIQVGSNK